MKNRLILGVLMMFFIMQPGVAQDYAFRVMATKGANQIKSGDTWQPIKGFMQIKLTDEVKVVENGYLGLMHAKGSSLEVRKAGIHKVADLSQQISGGSSLMAKYADFMLSNNPESKKNKLSATGAVHRGFGILVYLPESQYTDVYNDKVTVKWQASKAGGPYLVSVSNLYGDEITSFERQETYAEFDLSSPELAKESNILVAITPKSDPTGASNTYMMKRLGKAQREAIQKSLEELRSGFQGDNALNHLVLASFFEEQKLLIDAIGEFEKAIKMAPDVESYREVFDEFLLRLKGAN